MAIYMLGAFMLAFLSTFVFGKRYVFWLGKKDVCQPLKDEVARIYDQSEESTVSEA